MLPVGYTYDSDTWCKDCLPVNDESEEVGAIFSTDEWDYDVHCNACGELLLWKYKECSICTNPIWEYQEYTQQSRHYFDGRDSDEQGRYVHTDCLGEQEN